MDAEKKEDERGLNRSCTVYEDANICIRGGVALKRPSGLPTRNKVRKLMKLKVAIWPIRLRELMWGQQIQSL